GWRDVRPRVPRRRVARLAGDFSVAPSGAIEDSQRFGATQPRTRVLDSLRLSATSCTTPCAEVEISPAIRNADGNMPRVAVMASAPMSAAPDTALTTAFLVRCAAPTVTAWRLLAGPTKASDTLLDSMALASMPVRPPSVFVRASLPFTFREERRFVRLAIAR